MPLIDVGLLLRCRPGSNAIRAAVEAGVVVDVGVVDHRPVDIRGVDDGRVHVDNRGVVGKHASAPFTAAEAHAAVAEAIVHAAVKAHMLTPVAAVPVVVAAFPTPVTGRPEQSRLRRQHPCSWNPVVAVGAPCPVSRSPDVIRCRADRLYINGKDRRGNVDRDADGELSERGARYSAQDSDEGQVSKPAKYFHFYAPCRSSFVLPRFLLRCWGFED